MTKYMVKRLAQIVPVLFIVSFAVFVLVYVAGDPTATMLSPEATDADRATLREALGLDKPLLEQYRLFLSNMIKGDFGRSFRYREDALTIVLERIPASLSLAGLSLFLALIAAIPLGIIGAQYRNSKLDVVIEGLSVLGRTMPSFWVGIMLILLFAVILRWLPVSGRGTPLHAVLPGVTLAFATSAQIVPLMRSSMLDIMHEDYIRTAKSKGLNQGTVIFKHAFKNALVPVVTIVALQIPNLIGSSLVTETVFAWPGLGLLMVQAINGRDMCIVQACIMIITLITITVNLITDLVYCLIDPRIKL
jgi:peptide/nickel transport system permease protein